MKKIFTLAAFFTFVACSAFEANYPKELRDNDISTVCVATQTSATFTFDDVKFPMVSYNIYSSGETPDKDPSGWVLFGSDNGKKWKTIDSRKDIKFCARFQEIACVLDKPVNYKYYKLEIEGQGAEIALAEISFMDSDPDKGWHDFIYPEVNFVVKNPENTGAKEYGRLVQDIDEYVKWHARKVAEILFYSNADTIAYVKKVDYILREFDGVAYKNGDANGISINFSTNHIEKSISQSLYNLDFETRGVFYHELTHGYQYEPKGCGNYGSPDKIFWSFIEGVADAVRAQAKHFDLSTRKPGGNWLDGYRTTGFFIQWMTLEDPDAIRKFHHTALELDVWSWDGAMKIMFGPEATVATKWEEYQQWLLNGQK